MNLKILWSGYMHIMNRMRKRREQSILLILHERTELSNNQKLEPYARAYVRNLSDENLCSSQNSGVDNVRHRIESSKKIRLHQIGPLSDSLEVGKTVQLGRSVLTILIGEPDLITPQPIVVDQPDVMGVGDQLCMMRIITFGELIHHPLCDQRV